MRRSYFSLDLRKLGEQKRGSKIAFFFTIKWMHYSHTGEFQSYLSRSVCLRRSEALFISPQETWCEKKIFSPQYNGCIIHTLDNFNFTYRGVCACVGVRRFSSVLRKFCKRKRDSKIAFFFTAQWMHFSRTGEFQSYLSRSVCLRRSYFSSILLNHKGRVTKYKFFFFFNFLHGFRCIFT